MIEEAKVELQKGHEPELIADFLDAHILAGDSGRVTAIEVKPARDPPKKT